MPQNAAETRKAILENARKEFLAHGFAGASLRIIASGAGVTTGALYRHFSGKYALFEALVSPVREEVIRRFRQQTDEYISLLDSQGMQPLWNLSGRGWGICGLVRYIYRHFDEFRLLFLSDQTICADFLHMLIQLDVDSTRRYFAEALRRGYSLQVLDEQELHILANAQFSVLPELISHGIPEDQALRSALTVERFFVAGWKEVMLQEL